MSTVRKNNINARVMTVRIGINPLTWTNDDLPALGDSISLETCLSEGKSVGYAGFELGRKFPRQAQELESKMSEFGLDIVSGWYSSQLLHRDADQEIESIQAHTDLLLAMGCKVMVFCDVSGCTHGDRSVALSKRPKMSDSQWDLFLPRLQKVADYLAGRGIKMAYHHHMGTTVQSIEDIDRLMSGTSESVGLLLDTGHLTYSGTAPQDVIKAYADRIVHVHCKDVRANVLEKCLAEDASFLDAVVAGVFTVPGDGSVDYPPVFAELKQRGYQGWFVVEAEQDPSIAN